jgi:hypothetical protein
MNTLAQMAQITKSFQTIRQNLAQPRTTLASTINAGK